MATYTMNVVTTENDLLSRKTSAHGSVGNNQNCCPIDRDYFSAYNNSRSSPEAEDMLHNGCDNLAAGFNSLTKVVLKCTGIEDPSASVDTLYSSKNLCKANDNVTYARNNEVGVGNPLEVNLTARKSNSNTTHQEQPQMIGLRRRKVDDAQFEQFLYHSTDSDSLIEKPEKPISLSPYNCIDIINGWLSISPPTVEWFHNKIESDGWMSSEKTVFRETKEKLDMLNLLSDLKGVDGATYFREKIERSWGILTLRHATSAHSNNRMVKYVTLWLATPQGGSIYYVEAVELTIKQRP